MEEKPLWKMPRFRDVEAAVSSYRTEAERLRAMQANETDKIPRQGVNSFKAGIYNVPHTTLPC